MAFIFLLHIYPNRSYHPHYFLLMTLNASEQLPQYRVTKIYKSAFRMEHRLFSLAKILFYMSLKPHLLTSCSIECIAISQVYTHKDLGIMISPGTPYISLVRSQLLFCSVLWKPCLLKDIGETST